MMRLYSGSRVVQTETTVMRCYEIELWEKVKRMTARANVPIEEDEERGRW